MKARCAITYMNLGPYHIARLRALAEVLPDIHVIEMAGEQKLYPWRPDRAQLGFPVTTLFQNRACEAISSRAQCNGVKAALSELSPEVVVVAGYREPCMRAATNWASRRGIPVVLQFVSTYQDRPRRWWTERLKTRLLRKYAIVAAMGQRAEEYATRLGADHQRVRRIGNVVDNDYYATRAESIRQRKYDERHRCGVPTEYFLSVSRLSPEKNLLRLLSAFAVYRRCGGCWDLVLVGSGPQEGQLRARVQEHQLSGVHFLPWKAYEELPFYYALASCLVLPSISEPWGLVVNEAMASGLPVLVSRDCGCVPELCREGENGYAFDPDSAEELAESMLRVSSSNGDLSAMAQASRRIIASFTPQSWALRLKECIEAAAQRRSS